jgi:hypothetical protein
MLITGGFAAPPSTSVLKTTVVAGIGFGRSAGGSSS